MLWGSLYIQRAETGAFYDRFSYSFVLSTKYCLQTRAKWQQLSYSNQHIHNLIICQLGSVQGTEPFLSPPFKTRGYLNPPNLHSLQGGVAGPSTRSSSRVQSPEKHGRYSCQQKMSPSCTYSFLAKHFQSAQQQIKL